MLAKVQKWGNSLALRVPKALAEEIGVGPNSPVEMTVRDNALVIEPARKRSKYDLDRMLDEITPDNLQREITSGDPVGKEVW